MAERTLVRRILAIFDRASAKKSEQEFKDSLAKAGTEGGKAFLRELRAAFDKRMADLKVALAKGLIDEKQFKKQAALAAKEFNAGVIKGMEDARKAGNLTDKEFLKLSRTLKKTGDEGATAWSRIKGGIVAAGAALGAFFGARALVRFGQSAVREAAESEKVWRELAGTVTAAGQSFETMEATLVSLSKTFQKTTIHTDEDFARSLQRLIALTGNVSGSIGNMNLVADIAARFFGGDLVAATEAVAKGMNNGVVIINRMRFSLDELAKRSIGAAAEQTETFTGKLKQINNEWGEFKEQLGDVLVGSRDTFGAMDVLKGAVITLTTEINNNKEAIRTWISKGLNKAIEGMRTFLQLRGLMSFTAGTPAAPLADDEKGLKRQIALFDRQAAQIEKELADIQKQLEAAEAKGGLFGRMLNVRKSDELAARIESLNADLTSTGDQLATVERNATVARAKLAALANPTPAVGTPLGSDAERQKELAKELEKVLTDTAVARLQFEKGLTEGQAREQVRREQLLAGHVERTKASVAELTAAYAELARAQGIVGVLASTATQRTGTLGRGTESTAPGALPIPGGGLPETPDQKTPAKEFFDPWFEAMHLLRDEVEGEGSLFAELGQAWAEGGLAGFARLAAAKVKENIARAIEEAAKAFGSFALGNPAAATAHAKAAAGHAAAATAWKVAGGAAGGGGIGSGGGGIAAGAGPGSDRASRIDTKPEVHVHLSDRLSALVDDVDLQKMFYVGQERFREKVGNNVKVIVHRGSR